MCGESYFVDDLVFENVNKVSEETLENPFLCQECVELYDEAAYQH